MTEIKRKPGESIDAFLRRLNRRILETRLLKVVKERRFYRKPVSRRLRKMSALKREGSRARIEYLQKVGKLKIPSTKQRSYSKY